MRTHLKYLSDKGAFQWAKNTYMSSQYPHRQEYETNHHDQEKAEQCKCNNVIINHVELKI